jgi:gluconolactonase
MKRKVWFAMFAGLVGCPLVAGAQQGAPVVCVGTPQFAAQAAAAAQNPGQGRAQAPVPARGTAPPPPDITTAEIPGVIAAGLKWTKIWEALGNNADGIVADKNGNILIAQEEASAAIKIDKNDKASVLIANTKGAGSFSIDQQGRLLAVQRMAAANAPNENTPNAPQTAAIVELAPQRKIVANTFADGSTLPGRPGDLIADSKGGAYFTQGCLYYAAPNGKISLAGDDLRTNGIALSPDNKTLYVTNGAAPGPGGRGRGAGGAPGTIVAFDVQPDGTLKNRRTFATLQSGNGDGSAVDAAGRLYVAVNTSIQVFAPDGKPLGSIPTPGGVISVAFGGPNRKALYVVVNAAVGPDGALPGVVRTMRAFRIPSVAQGLKNRGK